MWWHEKMKPPDCGPLARELRWVLLYSHWRPVAVVLAIILSTISFWLLLPWDSVSLSPSYRLLASVAGDEFWGVVCLVLALLMWRLALCRTGRVYAIVVTLTTASFMAILAVGIWVVTIWALAVPVYTTLALTSGWLYVRVRMEGDNGIFTV
jgi:hypothetical protein